MSEHVVVAKYKDVIGAKDAIAAVKDAGIKLEDQAYVLNNGDGDLEFKEGKDAGGVTGARPRGLDRRGRGGWRGREHAPER